MLLLAVLVNEHASLRAADGLLVEDGPPHMTVGMVADGEGWVDDHHSRCVIWRIAGPPRAVEGRDTLAWSQDTVRLLDLSAFARDLQDDLGLFGASALGPVAAEVRFEADRFVLTGGAALRVFRDVQGRFERDLRTSIGFARVPYWPLVSGCTSGLDF